MRLYALESVGNVMHKAQCMFFDLMHSIYFYARLSLTVAKVNDRDFYGIFARCDVGFARRKL
jgi:hypothetical protein